MSKPTPNAAKKKETRNFVPFAIVAALVVIVGAAAWFLVLRPGAHTPKQPAALTADAKSYVRNLGLAGVEMKAKESMMGGMLVEITGQIANKGDRTLSSVELVCVFYDTMGQPVLRERVPIVRNRGGAGLKPGETRNFRMPFDNIPQSWNQALPQLVIASIEFQQ